MSTDLGLIVRETPWGVAERDSKRSLYRIADPFLAFWGRFVEPNRSVLEARRLEPVCEAVRLGWGQHVGGVWECLCRQAVTSNDVAGQAWGKPSRWYGIAPVDGVERVGAEAVLSRLR